jgi:CheY-like chemotaxis protein
MKRILFVDDEPLLLEVIQARLGARLDAWDMDFVGSGEEALQRLDRHGYDMVVADMRMPEMDGKEFLTAVSQSYPQTIRVLMSGQSDCQDSQADSGFAHFSVSKPFKLDDLEDSIARALSAPVTDTA